MKRTLLPISLPAALIFSSLTACGGGGSSDDASAPAPTPTPTIAPTTGPTTTPTPTPAATVASTEKAAANAALAVSLLQKVGAQFQQSPGTKARKFTQACDGGGQIIFPDQGQSSVDVGSPFTSSAFDVFDVTFENCTIAEEDETSSFMTTADGALRAGSPSDGDNTIGFAGFGSTGAPFSSLTRIDEGGFFLETDTTLLGVIHTLFAEDGSRVELSQILSVSGTARSNDPQFPAESEFTTVLGTDANPFAFSSTVNGSILELTLDGALGFDTPDAPAECELNSAIYETIQPLQIVGDQLSQGRIAITQDGNRAEIQFNSDGSSDVFVNGESQMFTAEELAALAANCDQSGNAFDFGLGFGLGFIGGF